MSQRSVIHINNFMVNIWIEIEFFTTQDWRHILPNPTISPLRAIMFPKRSP